MQIDLEIQAAIMDDVDKYTGVKGHHMPRYEANPYPQRLSILNENLKLHTLREIGDIKRYLELQEQIIALGSPTPPLYTMMKWLDTQMEAIRPVTGERGVVVLSLLAFGEDYAQRMLKYTLPSLMAFENLPCLAIEKRVVIYIQTNEAGRKMFEDAPIVAGIKALGVYFDYAVIPDEVMGLLKDKDIIYWMLGAGASLGIHYAKSLKAAFHHSYPDVVYSNKFFSELLRLSKEHKAILAPGMRSDETLLIPALEEYNTPTSLSIPAGDLLAHHMNSIHICSWPYVVNNRQYQWTYPQGHVMIWESPDTISINSPHLNALWLDYSVIKDLPPRFYWTLDSEMDLICKEEDFYIPQECDELYQAELSPPGRQLTNDRYADVITCSRQIWTAVTHRDTVKFFLRGMRTKLNKDIRKCDNAMTDKQIKCEMNFLFNAILGTDPYTTSKLPLKRTHEGRFYG